MLVLVDELAGSCGDAFPMLIKNNKVAKIFGKRTMGLGGKVESMDPLPNSQTRVRLTRGLFTSHREDKTYFQPESRGADSVIWPQEFEPPVSGQPKLRQKPSHLAAAILQYTKSDLAEMLVRAGFSSPERIFSFGYYSLIKADKKRT